MRKYKSDSYTLLTVCLITGKKVAGALLGSEFLGLCTKGLPLCAVLASFHTGPGARKERALLVQQVEHAMDPEAGIPVRAVGPGGNDARFVAWYPAKKHLLKDWKGGNRNVELQYATYAELPYLWPPPVLDLYEEGGEHASTTASCLWTTEWSEDADWNEVLTGIKAKVGEESRFGLFRLCNLF